MTEPRSSEPPKPPSAPFLVRFGGLVGAATIASLLGSMPAAFRLSAAADVDVLRAWLTLAGLALAPMLLLLPLARLAREGLRGVVGGDGKSALARVAAAIFFACTWLWFVSLLGAVLRAHTHHRALGGVTFALVALAAGVFFAMIARRLSTVLASLRAQRRALGTAAAALAIALSLGVLGLRVARAAPALSAGGRASLVDGLALALALAFCARKTFEDRRLVARLGPPAAFVLLVLAMHTLATSMAAALGIEHACPVYFALLRAFAKLGV